MARLSPSLRRLALPAILLAAAAPAQAQDLHTEDLRSAPLRPGVIRVCADPDNLPLSSIKGGGIENRIAELLGRAWNVKVEYAWWPVRRGFFTRALNGRYCDVAITAPSELDMAAVTKPYFRSAYVIVYRQDSGLAIRDLDDPALKRLRIGIHLLNSDAENTPPAMALSAHGVVGNLVGFGTFFSEGGDRPEDIIKAVADRRVDVAIVWGPIAGYFARQSAVPLTLVPLEYDSASGMPFAFNFSMGVRRRDRELRDSLDRFIEAHASELQGILTEFGVPLLPVRRDTTRSVGLGPAR